MRELFDKLLEFAIIHNYFLCFGVINDNSFRDNLEDMFELILQLPIVLYLQEFMLLLALAKVCNVDQKYCKNDLLGYDYPKVEVELNCIE